MLTDVSGRGAHAPSSNDRTTDPLAGELRRILASEAVTPLFQPIVHNDDGHVFGYEALTRGPKGSPLEMPDKLFATARRHRMLAELDMLCRRKAVIRFMELGLSGRLFLNIDPNRLSAPGQPEIASMNALMRHGMPANRIVIELTEQQQVMDLEALKRAAAHYRRIGFGIAMDDLSAGYSNLQRMNELRPDYIKLDKYFINKLPDDSVAREFSRAICRLARSINCQVIAEGVERACELEEVRKLRIDFSQGYLFGRPALVPEVTWVIDDPARNMPPTGPVAHDITTRIGDLRVAVAPDHPDTPARDVFRKLQRHPDMMAVPVVDNGQVAGICERNAMLFRFSVRFGHELYSGKPVRQVMNAAPLVTDVSTPLDIISPRVTGRPTHLLYEPLVLTEHEQYAGIVYVHDLLDRITEDSVRRAMECNPLTGLPGNNAIAGEVNRRLAEKEPFVLCYVDLDNFKAFNDRYGYERGDAMIGLLAEILREHREDGDFIGHIGGDDFILILEERPGWPERIARIMQDFRDRVEALYDPEDLARGCIQSRDRAGRPCCFDLASLSVGAVPCPPGRFASHLEAAESAVALKCNAKKQRGNALAVDRRQ